MSATVPPAADLADAACRVLLAGDPDEKVRLTAAHAEAWRSGALPDVGTSRPPDRPARPDRPVLLLPRDMPRRSKSGAQGRIAFLHAIAHIEFNAIDLAWDMVVRFTGEDMPRAFLDDWVGVAADEARHFDMLSRRLRDMDGEYGDLPAHDGLWEAATDTADDLLARLAIVPMVLEARGLDTTPKAVERLRAHGDAESARILETIGHEEGPHVAAGVRWFEHLARRRGLDPVASFHELVESRFSGTIKPPFNMEARRAAGLHDAYMAPYVAARDGAAA